MDSVGIGELPDAAVLRRRGQQHPGQHLARGPPAPAHAARTWASRTSSTSQGVPPVASPRAAFARMAERSPGKDSVTGHWELMGLVLDQPVPGVSRRVPRGDHRRVRAANRARRRWATRRRRARQSSTNSGPSTCAPGRPIVYTSADSVFQIAAHEDVIPVPELYRMCEVAFELVSVGRGVGRVIAQAVRRDARARSRARRTGTTTRGRRRPTRCWTG